MKIASILLASLFLISRCEAQSATNPKSIPPCFTSIANNFFSYPVISQAFSLNRIPQSRWLPIYQALQTNSRQIPHLFDEAAKQYQPNPLNPYQPYLVGEVMKQVLYNVFAMSLWQYGITNQSDIRQMFKYISVTQSGQFTACFGQGSGFDQPIIE